MSQRITAARIQACSITAEHIAAASITGAGLLRSIPGSRRAVDTAPQSMEGQASAEDVDAALKQFGY